MIKTWRKEPPRDQCDTSIQLIRERVITSKALSEKVWIPDDPNDFYNPSGEQVLETLLLGGFLQRIAEIPYWPKDKRYKLWVISSRMRQVLNQTLGLPSEMLGLIPRPLLEDTKRSSTAVDLKKDFTFFVAGRLSSVKNLESVIYFVHSLQALGAPAHLVFQGRFDNEKHENLGRRVLFDYELVIKDLVMSLNWKRPPEFLGAVGPQEWLSSAHPQKIYLSFSTFMGEDFGMALTQAREAGWPAITTDWGGLADYSRRDDWLVPAYFVSQGDSPASYGLGLGQALAEAFLKGGLKNEEDMCSDEVTQPKEMSYYDLVSFSEKVVEKLGRPFLGALREDLDYFADTARGSTFFREYSQIFEGDQGCDDHLIIRKPEGSVLKKNDDFYFNLGLQQVHKNERVTFITSLDLGFSDNLVLINKAKKITVLDSKELRAQVNDLLGTDERVVWLD